MKKLFAFFLAILSLCTCVQAQSEVDTNINPLNVARAFALNAPTHFKCNLSGRVADTNANKEWSYINMQFVVRKSDFAITNLTINGVSIPIPESEPLYGLPLNPEGLIHNVYVNAAAFNKNGGYAGNGHTELSYLSKGDKIELILKPADLRQEIPIEDIDEYSDNDIELDIPGFLYGYGYGISDGKFYVYLPPVGGRYHYVLRQRSTGQPIGDGWLEPFKSAVTPNNGYFGVQYEGGVVGVEFEAVGIDDWIGIPNVQFNSQIPRNDGAFSSGKAIFTDAGVGGLEVILGIDAEVYIYQATAVDGDMKLLATEDRSMSYEWGGFETRINTVARNVGKAVIIIVPKNLKWIDNVWLNLHRFYNLPAATPTTPVGKP